MEEALLEPKDTVITTCWFPRMEKTTIEPNNNMLVRKMVDTAIVPNRQGLQPVGLSNESKRLVFYFLSLLLVNL
jgi:hypothetical protein